MGMCSLLGLLLPIFLWGILCYFLNSNRLRTAITTVCLHHRSPPAATIVIPSSLPSGDIPNLSFNIFPFSIVLILTQQIFHRLNIASPDVAANKHP
ncbi:unnamed protein product [Lactuca virosa]|uniref:Secreted peptide n=1 Tax=Lactuca virosa TaxID=75947 RepID=A0AAU9LEJ8_9ASTR|nr:unnamed protein product [Lactuca virosa]